MAVGVGDWSHCLTRGTVTGDLAGPRSEVGCRNRIALLGPLSCLYSARGLSGVRPVCHSSAMRSACRRQCWCWCRSCCAARGARHTSRNVHRGAGCCGGTRAPRSRSAQIEAVPVARLGRRSYWTVALLQRLLGLSMSHTFA